jgi:hypothetical protein
MISVVDEAIKWILKNVYKESVINVQTINTEDVYSIPGRDNLRTYSYNDTISKLVRIAYNYLDLENIDETQFKQHISINQEIPLASKYITYPILSRVLDIPYRHFLTIPSEHAHLLNILTYHHLPASFKEEYSIISNLLLHYNKENEIPKTTYTIKNVEMFFDKMGLFLTFNNHNFAYEFYSQIVGKLSRNSYVSFKTGQDIGNFPLAKLESNMIDFYSNFFNNNLGDMFVELEDGINKQL